MGAGMSPAEPKFFYLVNRATFRQLRNGIFSNLVTKCSSVFRQWIRRDIFENFRFRGHLLPKSDSEIKSNRHLTQSRLQVTGCTAERYCLLHVVVQGPGSFRARSTFCTTYSCGDTVCQSCPFFGFWPIFHIQTPKTYVPASSLHPRGYITEWLRFFHVVVQGPKGCLLAVEFSCDFW